jgi:hypothetical protein
VGGSRGGYTLAVGHWPLSMILPSGWSADAGWDRPRFLVSSKGSAMINSAERRGEMIKLLESALAMADELNDGGTGYLIERALDEARARQFTPFNPPL